MPTPEAPTPLDELRVLVFFRICAKVLKTTPTITNASRYLGISRQRIYKMLDKMSRRRVRLGEPDGYTDIVKPRKSAELLRKPSAA